MTGHGGPRANSGGPRPGAGRKPIPRLSPAETRALLASLLGDDSIAAWARRLGVSRSALDAAVKRGASSAQVAGWMARGE